VIFDLLHSNIPTLNGVTLCAVRTHLPPMDILVAIGAILAHVGEYRLYVALNTRHLLVQSAQWIFGFVVIEFWHRAYRPPTCSRVTVLTGYGERSVRVLGGLVLGVRRHGRGYRAPDCRPPARA
jgi:hypothetical protein